MLTMLIPIAITSCLGAILTVAQACFLLKHMSTSNNSIFTRYIKSGKILFIIGAGAVSNVILMLLEANMASASISSIPLLALIIPALFGAAGSFMGLLYSYKNI